MAAVCPAAPLTAREEELCNGFQMFVSTHPSSFTYSSNLVRVDFWLLGVPGRPGAPGRLGPKDAAGGERAGGFNGEVLMSERAAAHLADPLCGAAGYSPA